MITQTYYLDMTPSGAPLVVHVSQYDKDARTLEFYLFNGGVDYTPAVGATANIRGTKPDATVFVYPMTLTGSLVSINLEQQMALVAGDVICEVNIVDTDGTINSANFILRVEPGAIDESTAISDTDIPIFTQLVQDAEDAADEAEQARDDAQQAYNDTAALFPAGGSTGQFLQKTAGGTAWEDVHDIPTGGSTGQVLAKDNNNNWSASWHTAYYIPSGGASGDVLTKNSGNDYDVTWQAPSGGGGGDIVVTISGNNPYTADYTFSQIETVISNGGTPIVKYNNAVYLLNYYSSGSQMYFDYWTGSGCNRFTITSADTISLATVENTATAANVSFDNTNTGYVATDVQAAIDEAATALAPNPQNATLTSGGWTNGEYTIISPYIHSNSVIALTYPAATSDADLAIIKAANIRHTAQGNGTLTIKALGTTPTSNITITMVIWG